MAVATSISTRPAFQPSQDAIRSVCALQLGLNMIEAVSEHGPAGLRAVIEKARSDGSIISAVYGLEMACNDVDAVRESLIPMGLGLSWLAELIENDIDGLMTVVDKAVMDGTIIEAAAYAEVARDIIERQPGF